MHKSMKHKALKTLLLTATTIAQVAVNAQPLGRFIGTIQTEWLPDGRSMRLLKDLTFVDSTGVEWEAPRGSIVDGASIPKVAWSVVGGPFEGKYRNASVIHDVACDKRIRAWESVHKAFYNAMLTSGVTPLRAKLMYAAVYHFGPRWPRISRITGNTNLISPLFSSPMLESEKNDLRKRLRWDLRVNRVAPGTSIELLGVKRVSSYNSGILGFSAEAPKIQAEFKLVPPERSLSQSELQRLQTLIEKQEELGQGGMSLDEIEAYPSSPSQSGYSTTSSVREALGIIDKPSTVRPNGRSDVMDSPPNLESK